MMKINKNNEVQAKVIEKVASIEETIVTEPEEIAIEAKQQAEVIEVQKDSKPEEIKLKPAQTIKKRFVELVNKNLITDEVIKILTDKESTDQAFKVRYAFLKEFDSNVPIKELTYINGNPRCYSKPFTLNGKIYLICNDLYKTIVPKFMEWADTLENIKKED